MISLVDGAQTFKMAGSILKECVDLCSNHRSGAGQGLFTVRLCVIVCSELFVYNLFGAAGKWCTTKSIDPFTLHALLPAWKSRFLELFIRSLVYFTNKEWMNALRKIWHHRNFVKELNNACWVVWLLCWGILWPPLFLCTIEITVEHACHRVVTQLKD